MNLEVSRWADKRTNDYFTDIVALTGYGKSSLNVMPWAYAASDFNNNLAGNTNRYFNLYDGNHAIPGTVGERWFYGDYLVTFQVLDPTNLTGLEIGFEMVNTFQPNNAFFHKLIDRSANFGAEPNMLKFTGLVRNVRMLAEITAPGPADINWAVNFNGVMLS